MTAITRTPPEKLIQFPIRITPRMSHDLVCLSELTRIPKTELTRMALQKFIVQWRESGAIDLVNDLCTP